MSDRRPVFHDAFENIPIDTKGRLIVPAKFRNELPNGVTSIIVTQWFDGCLAAFDPDGWRRIIDQLRNMGYSQLKSRQLVRAMAGRASEVKLDRQGRALIPRKRLDSVGITDRATLSGAIEYIEIWNPDRYNEAQNDTNMEDMEDVMVDFTW